MYSSLHPKWNSGLPPNTKSPDTPKQILIQILVYPSPTQTKMKETEQNDTMNQQRLSQFWKS